MRRTDQWRLFLWAILGAAMSLIVLYQLSTEPTDSGTGSPASSAQPDTAPAPIILPDSGKCDPNEYQCAKNRAWIAMHQHGKVIEWL